MIDKKNLIVKSGVMKVVGIFQRNTSHTQIINKFFEQTQLNEIENKIYKDLFYPNFREFAYIQDGRSKFVPIQYKYKTKDGFPITLMNRGAELPCEFSDIRIFLYDSELPISVFSFSVTLPADSSMSQWSDLGNLIRQFDTEIKVLENNTIKLYQWIQKEIFKDTVKIRDEKESIPVDNFSGSKFKVYNVLNISEPQKLEIYDELVFDIGTSSPIGSAGGDTFLSPSNDYYQSIISNKTSVFKNWVGLGLFDSYTIIGHNLLQRESSLFQPTYSETYFRIYIYSLFLKYSLLAYDNETQNLFASHETRKKLDKFIATYNFEIISYNFLPNLVFRDMKTGLNISDELQNLQEKVSKLSVMIQEEEQEKTNVLLGIVSAISAISGVIPILEEAEKFRISTNIPIYLFYPLLVLIGLILGWYLVNYLFEHKLKAFIGKMNKIWSR